MAAQFCASVNKMVYTHWPKAKRYKVLLPIGWAFFGMRYLVRMLLMCGILNAGMNVLLIVCGVFNPVTAIFTTLIAEIVLMAVLFWFVQKRLSIPFRFFTRTNVKYMLLSLTFLPITMGVRAIGLESRIASLRWGAALTSGIIIVICMALYFGVLLLMKDETMRLLTDRALNMFFGRFRSRRDS